MLDILHTFVINCEYTRPLGSTDAKLAQILNIISYFQGFLPVANFINRSGFHIYWFRYCWQNMILINEMELLYDSLCIERYKLEYKK